MPHPFAWFDRVAIINLPHRTDRRREVTAEFARIGGLQPNTAFFPAVRPDGPGPFPSTGARGCFLSHLGVLEAAVRDSVGTLLILEDDVSFAPALRDGGPTALDRLRGRDWGLFYGAHRIEGAGPLQDGVPLDPATAVLTTSFVALRGPAIAAAATFLRTMLGRPPGTAEPGPMHVDGAYSWFRRAHPALATYAAVPPLADQRASRSDVSDAGPFLDRVPGLRTVATWVRQAKRTVAG